jgi:hypothetical protein
MRRKKVQDVDDIDVDDAVEDVFRQIKPPTVPKPDKKAYYVDEDEFKEEIRKFYATDKMTDNLGVIVHKIANGLSHRPNFINYSFRDEMVQDAILNMVKALNNKKFDLNKGYNPFSYFTCIAFHTFCTRIKKEKKQRDAVELFQEEFYPELMKEGKNRGNHDDTE